MCGIAGFTTGANSGKEMLTGLAGNMTDELQRRGPDDSGSWSDERVGICLAHRRLAIQDLSPMGHQPMVSPSGRYVMTFNGEIYNFHDLRANLAGAGFRFRGHSDTEVLLALIEQRGLPEALKATTGMFALAVWDRDERILHLARDRMGEKPLYYGWLNGNFVFASELRALRVLPWWGPPELSSQALHTYFRHGYIPTPHSAYQGIYKLCQGTILSASFAQLIDNTGFHPESQDERSSGFGPRVFWDLESAKEQGQRSQLSDLQEATDRIDDLLHQTIKNQLISDVPVGMFLSGGIDSSLVTAVAQAVSSTPVRTFTIGFQEQDFDEAKYAREIAQHLGTQHLELYVSPDEARDAISLLPKIYDEPFADPSEIPTYLISRLARENVTVALSGDGGDELFGGYNRYLYPLRVAASNRRIPLPFRQMLAGLLRNTGPATLERLYKIMSLAPVKRLKGHTRVGLKLHKLADALIQDSEFSTYEHLISYWPDDEVPLARRVDSGQIIPGRFASLFTEDFLGSAMLYDQQVYLPDNNLTKVDRASMFASLETRLPLLDHRMVELSWRVPNDFKIRDGAGKFILREVLTRHLPASLFERPKMGFSVPIANWLRGPLRDWAAALLDPAVIAGQGILESAKISQCFESHLRGKADNSLQLWAVLMFQAWLAEAHRS